MRIAFVGKGGSGKTTPPRCSPATSPRRRRPVVAIDADINQHLAAALGASDEAAAARRWAPQLR